MSVSPLLASYVTTVNESVPGGDGGPATVHPAVQLPLTTFVTAGLFASVPGAMPTESAVRAMETDSVLLETYFGRRALPEFFPRAGILIVNIGVTRLPDGVTGALVGEAGAGALLPPPQPRKRRDGGQG